MLFKIFIVYLLVDFLIGYVYALSSHININYTLSINTSVPPCLDFMSVSLVNGTTTNFGSIIFNGLTFTQDTQFSINGELRGCPCKLKKCIKMCCKPGNFLDKECHKPINNSRSAMSLIPDGIFDPVIRNFENHFYVLYDKTCLSNSKYGIFASGPKKILSDSFTITADGILKIINTENNIIKTQEFDQETYCIGWSEYNVGIKFTICHNTDVNNQKMNSVKEWIMTAGNWLSALFLILTFIVYSLFSELRNIHGKTLMSYVASLTNAFIFLTIIKHRNIQKYLEISKGCAIIAYIVHFSFLASFFWLNVMCFDIWWTFGGFRSLYHGVKQRNPKKFIFYSIYAWGCASVLTITCMIMDMIPGIPSHIIRPKFSNGRCWFESHAARAIYFYGPMGVTVFCNICLFILTALKIMQHKKDTGHQLKNSYSKHHDENKQWFNLYLKLFIVMGVIWSMEIISWLFENVLPNHIWFITDLANTLHGITIFVIFVCKKKVKHLLMKHFNYQNMNIFFSNFIIRRRYTNTSYNSRTVSTTAMPVQNKIDSYMQSEHSKPCIINESNSI